MNPTPTTAFDWSNLFPAPLGEREKDPRALRFPVDVAAGIKELAEDSGQDFTAVALYLLKAALAEVQAAKKKNGSKKGASTRS